MRSLKRFEHAGVECKSEIGFCCSNRHFRVCRNAFINTISLRNISFKAFGWHSPETKEYNNIESLFYFIRFSYWFFVSVSGISYTRSDRAYANWLCKSKSFLLFVLYFKSVNILLFMLCETACSHFSLHAKWPSKVLFHFTLFVPMLLCVVHCFEMKFLATL